LEEKVLMELLRAIQSRRSIRKFKSDPVPDIYIKELLEAARLAPSGSNLQPARYVVIKSEKERAKLKECTPLPFVVNAPVVIACCIDKGVMGNTVERYKELMEAKAFVDTPLADGTVFEAYAKRRGRLDQAAIKAYLTRNASIAIEHIALRAVDRGRGSGWSMMVDSEKTRRRLELDDRDEGVALVPDGYPDQSPAARPRVPMEELVIKGI